MKPLIVLYYHRILPFKGYDIDLSTFEWQLSFLKKHFDIVGAEVFRKIKNGEKLKRSSVLITFDDGYADNYVYAYPMLKKYGAKALLFIPTSKITHSKKRKTLFDCWNKGLDISDLYTPDKKERALEDSLKGDLSEFLHWEEIEEMAASGVFDIGSHGHIHSKIFSSDTVVGIYAKDRAHWSFAYANDNDLRQGVPIFEMRSSLSCRRFTPFEEFKQYCIDMYENDKQSVPVDKLNKYKNKGEYESDFKQRIAFELATSKELIKENLGIDTEFLSWPWGEYSDSGIETAKSLGFKFCFTTKKSAFFNGDFCKIGRIKSPQRKMRFVRKMFLNSNTFFANIYKKTH